MSSHKLPNLLQALHRADFLRLRDFLESPFFNKEKKLVGLYDALRPHHPGLRMGEGEWQAVFAKLYPGKPYNLQLLRNLMTRLTRLTEQYLVQLQLEKEGATQEKIRLRACAARQEKHSDFFELAEKRKAKLLAEPHESAARHLELFQLEKQVFGHPGTQKFLLPPERLDAAMLHLDRFYLLEKLLLGNEVKTREHIFSETHRILLWEELLVLARQQAADSPLLAALSGMNAIIATNDEAAYWQLKTLLAEQSGQLPFPLRQDLLGSLVNFAVRLGNAGREDFQNENLELYNLGLPLGLLHDEGVLDHMVFLNIVKVAIKLKAYQWGTGFVAEYAAGISPDVAGTASTMARALLLFHQGQYPAALAQLDGFAAVNEFYKHDWRELMLKSRYDLALADRTLFPVVASEAAAFEKLLGRDKKTAQAHLSKRKNLASIVRQMAVEQAENKGFPSQKLLDRASDPSIYASSSWLLEKLGMR